MANRYATQSGNWSDTNTWDGNTLPAVGDVVRSNGKIINIDQDINVLELRTDSTGVEITKGYFYVSGDYSLSCNVYGGDPSSTSLTTSSTPTLWLFGPASTINLVGTVSGGPYAYGCALVIDSSCSANLNVTGNIIGGSYAGTVDPNVTSVNQSYGNGSVGLRNEGYANLNLVGNVSGGTGRYSWAVMDGKNRVNLPIPTWNVSGNIVSDRGFGLLAMNTLNLNVTGNVIGKSENCIYYRNGTFNLLGNVYGPSENLIPKDNTRTIWMGAYTGSSVLNVSGDVYFPNGTSLGQSYCAIIAQGYSDVVINGNLLSGLYVAGNMGSAPSHIYHSTIGNIIVNGNAYCYLNYNFYKDSAGVGNLTHNGDVYLLEAGARGYIRTNGGGGIFTHNGNFIPYNGNTKINHNVAYNYNGGTFVFNPTSALEITPSQSNNYLFTTDQNNASIIYNGDVTPASGSGYVFFGSNNSQIIINGNVEPKKAVNTTSQSVMTLQNSASATINGNLQGSSVFYNGGGNVLYICYLYNSGSLTVNGEVTPPRTNSVLAATVYSLSNQNCYIRTLRSYNTYSLGGKYTDLAAYAAFLGKIIIKECISELNCQVPFAGNIVLEKDQNAFIHFENSNSELITLKPTDVSADFPPVSSVRLGTKYNSSAYEGTLVVPSVSSVAYGVPVDNTTGTAILTSSSILTALGLNSANLDTQLSNITAQAQIAAQNTQT